ncbi:hypothetical protein C5Y87_21480 [Escherichia coli]|nr:hypothetical protein C5Y87_21480 [Escherichia coli]PQK62372.1 hypothetical protein C5Y94_17965 [Escherichia coli]
MSLKRMVNLTTRCPQRGRNNPAILTAAPFRGLPQPEAHGRRKFNDRLSMNQLQAIYEPATSPCAFALWSDFSGKYPFSKLSVPDAHPCPAHALHLTRGELLNY